MFPFVLISLFEKYKTIFVFFEQSGQAISGTGKFEI